MSRFDQINVEARQHSHALPSTQGLVSGESAGATRLLSRTVRFATVARSWVKWRARSSDYPMVGT